MSRPLALVALVAFVGCQGKPRDEVRASASSEASAFPPIQSAVAHRVHYLERAGDRCILYSLVGRERSLGPVVTCPSGLNDGERIHLAGRACLRESGDAARSVPMRCPVELVDAGEATGAGAR
jgi:hypothetical protein